MDSRPTIYIYIYDGEFNWHNIPKFKLNCEKNAHASRRLTDIYVSYYVVLILGIIKWINRSSIVLHMYVRVAMGLHSR